MSIEIIVPSLGESVSEATIAKWFKAEGDSVVKDEILVELETDKVTLEVNAQASGKLSKINMAEDSIVEVGQILGAIEKGAAGNAPAEAEAAKGAAGTEAAAPAPASKAETATAGTTTAGTTTAGNAGLAGSGPAARKIVAENNLNPAQISGSGKDGRITKGDALGVIGGQTPAAAASNEPRSNEPREERVKMSKLRRVIAKRLKDSQNTAAILTTFNEVDMTEVMALRAQYKDAFLDSHDVKLGFMSFFTKAAISALKELPAVNAEIDGDEIIYKNYYDIGMAVGTPQGLVVPVVRDADRLSFAGIEQTIVGLGKKARDGKLGMSDLQGGTFTISNGGVYGSLLSTPIINPPQSGILGLHKIQKRAVVMEDGSIEARPMMYLALSYDHRIVDGREAVTFLVKVKEIIEDPRRLLLDL